MKLKALQKRPARANDREQRPALRPPRPFAAPAPPSPQATALPAGPRGSAPRGHHFGEVAVRGHGPARAAAGGTGLPDGLREGVEKLSGLPLDDVEVHYDSPAPARLKALAYTQGAHIHVGPGQERHLAHEVWHVVQQKQGRVRPTAREAGAAINDSAGLEKEADVMGERALRHEGAAGLANVIRGRAGFGRERGPARGDLRPRAFARSAGPHLDAASAPLQLLRGATSFSWGIWARGGGSTTRDPHLRDIHEALGRYHRDRSQFDSDQEFSDHRARALDDAQQALHRHIGQAGDLAQQGGSSRDYMLDLMDELQQAHVEHTDYVHQNNLNLYSAENLSHQERQQLNADWNEVRGGQGTVRMPQGQEHEADNRALRANFARLMSRQTGRGLVRGILAPRDDQQPWRIEMSHTERLPPDEQARREANRRDYQQARALYEDATHRHEQGGENAPTEQEVLGHHQALMQFLDESRNDYRNTEADEPAAASQQPHGASLRVLSGLKDSENFAHSGVNTGLIPSPSHVLLGHELIHALHYKLNQNDPGNPDDYAHGTPLSHWSNAEEHRTIQTGPGPTENLLRAEHSLTAREGHTAKSRRELDAEEAPRRLREEEARRRRIGLGVGALAVFGGLAYGLHRFRR